VPLGYVPIAGHIVYQLDPDWITLAEGWTATPKTFVDFRGRTAYAERSRIPFHVTSLDWQESDRILAGIMTAFGSPTGATPIGGYGEFDGVMLGAFGKPRIEGVFSGDRMRAWDVVWGHGRAEIVVENGYALVSKSEITSGGSVITAEGKFSLGYPRRDNGEEIDARVRLIRRPMADLRHAFELDDYPVEGLVSGEYHLYGNYETPFGFGTLLIEDGVAYGETFEKATAALRFEGTGVRLDTIDVKKSTGSMTGAAWVGWAGDYSFNVDGRRIPVESLKALAFPKAPLSGLMQFNASGAGTFDVPRYDVKLRVDDLFAGEEGIGQVTTNLAVRGEMLVVTLEAASPRLVVSGSGRIALTPEMDAEMTLRFDKTSLDPYIRFFQPQMSPFTTAIAGGTVRVVGELSDIDHLVVDTRVEDLDLKLFDYRLRNLGPIELSLDQHVLEIQHFTVAGDGTELALDGNVAFDDNRIEVSAAGDANLGILQGFFRDIRSSGAAALKATVSGPLEKPVFSGSATLKNGRIRHFSLPHSLEAINGRIAFDAAGLRFDDVAARLGGGDVRFGGRIAMNGFALGDLSLTATGEQMHVRYPEGFRSVVDADLSLRGNLAAPVLSGTVTIHDAVWSRRIDANVDIFSLTRGSTPTIGAPAAATTFPLRFDVQIIAPPGSLRVETGMLHLASSADLKLQGTYDRPLLFGRATIDRGDLIFEGNRYLVTRGSIDFFNPTRIEPFFDVEAETRIRVPSQTFRVTVGVTGTINSISPSLNSDPPLPQIDIMSLLLGQTTDVQNAELRSLRPGAATQSEQQLLQAAGARLLTGAISAPVGRAVGETLGIDTVQIAPMLGTGENDPLTPSARLIIGKRISNRAYITFARALGTASRDQILVLEYDQSDTLGWVLTQNGDRTFAIDFRVRHRF
jgi:translocation and assembly module TamB